MWLGVRGGSKLSGTNVYRIDTPTGCPARVVAWPSNCAAFGDGREVKLAVDLAGFGIPSVLITTRTDVKDADNLVVITVPEFSTAIGNAILQAIPAQLLIATLSEDVGLPVCNFRYRQTDTKRDV